MNIIERIRDEVAQLYKTKPDIHISIKTTRPRVSVKNTPARIVGVYKNIFQIEESGLHVKLHTVKYSDLLVGTVAITELDTTFS